VALRVLVLWSRRSGFILLSTVLPHAISALQRLFLAVFSRRSLTTAEGREGRRRRKGGCVCNFSTACDVPTDHPNGGTPTTKRKEAKIITKSCVVLPQCVSLFFSRSLTLPQHTSAVDGRGEVVEGEGQRVTLRRLAKGGNAATARNAPVKSESEEGDCVCVCHGEAEGSANCSCDARLLRSSCSLFFFVLVCIPSSLRMRVASNTYTHAHI
jgi:hypothetical protein